MWNTYQVFRKDRKFGIVEQTRGGGVLLAVRSDIHCETIDCEYLDLSFPSIDILICKCFLYNKHIFIVVVYIPPALEASNMRLFLDAFEQLDFLQDKPIIIFGDFNVPSFVDTSARDGCKLALDNFITFFEFHQHNNVLNLNNRLLDLVFSNVACRVSRDKCPLLPEDLHHPALIVEICRQSFKKEQAFQSNIDFKSYNFKKANFVDLYRDMLNIDWSILLEINDINIAIDEFYNILYAVIDRHVPRFKHHKRKFPVWYTSELINNIKQKDKVRKKYRRTGNQLYADRFAELRRIIKEEIKVAYSSYLTLVENRLSRDPQIFWSYIQSKKDNSQLPAIMTLNDNIFSEPIDIVNGYADFFKSVYLPEPEHEAESNPIMPLSVSSHINIAIKEIEEQDIMLAAKKLKNKMTAGPDGIPSFFVKDCIGVLTAPLKIIFNLAVRNKTFPNRWKEAKVVPILKSGNKAEISNYRQISILSNFSKLLECTIYSDIYPLVKNQISHNQHGFMKQRSTVTNLATFTQLICETLDAGGQVDVICTDFAKAFDKMDRLVLLSKLSDFGFSTDLTQFLWSYLRNRTQYVYYNGHHSYNYTSTSGVPQGSNLGPLLFLLFINDLDSITTLPRALFADDFKIYSPISNIEDCNILQRDVISLEEWCARNKLALNISKCKVITFTRKQQHIHFDYTINNTVISRKSSITDLGVVFDTKLSFIDHVRKATSDASRAYGFIVRNCKNFNNVDTLKMLYYAFVRSKLEYACIVWFPIYRCYIAEVEQIQKRYLKYLSYKMDGTYPERGSDYSLLLERFDMHSFERIYFTVSIATLHNIMNNKISCPNLLAQINLNVPRLNSRNNLCFYCKRARTNMLNQSPLHKMCNNYNKICMTSDIFNCSLSTIKKIALNSLNVDH